MTRRAGARPTRTAGTAAVAGLALAAVAAAPAQAQAAWEQVHGSGEAGGSFDAVAAAGPDAVWAFGDDSAQNDGTTWIHRWDGAEWTREPTPDDWTVVPSAADAASADDVWAAGVSPQDGASALHYDGSSWSAVELDPALRPTDIEAVSSDAVWMLSEPVDGWDRAAFFDGEIWRDYPAPTVDRALSAVAEDDVFAVGRKGAQPGVDRWNGTEWQEMELPEVELPGGESDATFNDVVAPAADDVWAVGHVFWKDGEEKNHYRPLIGHYDGESWTVRADGEAEGSYVAAAEDGRGGLWIEDGGWNPVFVHRAADGATTRHEVDGGKYDLSVTSLASVPGGHGAVAAGPAFEEGDPDVFTDHGVVFGTGDWK